MNIDQKKLKNHNRKYSIFAENEHDIALIGYISKPVNIARREKNLIVCHRILNVCLTVCLSVSVHPFATYLVSRIIEGAKVR